MANFTNNRRTNSASRQKNYQNGSARRPQNGSKKQTPKTPKITARINTLVDREDSNIKAYASVTDGVLAIKGIKVIDSYKGLFVQMPQRTYEKNGETQYDPVAHPVTAEARQAVVDAVMLAYDKALIDDMNQQDGQSDDEDPGEVSAEGEDDLPFEHEYAPQMAQSM